MADPTSLINPGIYFGLDAETYHQDPALGGTQMNLLARDPVEFQYRRLAPEPEDTPALIRGQAQHARNLEGVRAFHQQFKIAPEKKDHPDPILDTMEDLREHAYAIGLEKLPRIKQDLIDLIRQTDRDVTIWQEIMNRHDADPRVGVSAKVAEQVFQAAEWMQADPLVGEVMKDGTFQGGAPEVSIFWTEDGVRCKARLDYLLPHAIVDLKTFGPWQDRPLGQSAIVSITNYRYDLQAAHYLRGWRQARSMWDVDGGKAVMTFDDIDRTKMLEFCSACFHGVVEEEPKWVWVFIKTIGAPQPIVIEWTREGSPLAYGSAENDVARALQNYRDFAEEFGADKPWPPRHEAVVISDADWPTWFGRR